MTRIATGFKALRQLGLEQVSLYALYQLGLRTGHYRRSESRESSGSRIEIGDSRVGLGTRVENRESRIGGKGNSTDGSDHQIPKTQLLIPFDLSFIHGIYPLAPADKDPLLALADEICAGQVRLFGGPPVPLNLKPPGSLAHWTEYELGRAARPEQEDIKYTWEPARFGWAYILGRAYQISRDEGYAQAFWRNTETFLQANPPFLGPNWTSGQEVALRLMAWVYAHSAFSASPETTPSRVRLLSEAVANHARRIPPTLVYARSQNNNHLLSEAAGLYTAGLALPDHPQAAHWRRLGWHWFNHGLQSQIAIDGTYVQHSVNYHRLMLQLALWVQTMRGLPEGLAFPEATRQRLSAASRWLSSMVDPVSGQAPNLGANDGALIMPLTPAPFSDFRTVAEAAKRQWSVVSGQRIVDSLQLAVDHLPARNQPDVEFPLENRQPSASNNQQSAIFNQQFHESLRVFLRAVTFTSRPSHADQLHLDLWWRGLNVALDAGTYLYNGQPPWDNTLASTAVHNTIIVNYQEQMTRAGRFLWLDWAQTEVTTREDAPDGSLHRITARHTGYRRLGVIHQRSVEIQEDGSLPVKDELLPARQTSGSETYTARLHWLLPDWPWSLQGNRLDVQSPYGTICLEVSGAETLTLARAGEVLVGPGPVTPITGWHSPSYGVKAPALALIAIATGQLPISFTSTWQFPK